MKVFKIVAVKDELTESFLNPQFIESIEEAERLFAFQINTIPLWRYNAEDYSLYSLGTYEPETGTMIGTAPVKIAGGRSVLKEKSDDIQSIEKTES